MASRIDRDLASIDDLYSKMEALLQRPETVLRERTAVSGWSVAEQVQHVDVVLRAGTQGDLGREGLVGPGADSDAGNNQDVDLDNPGGWHGGDIEGLIQQLDEIADLGATVGDLLGLEGCGEGTSFAGELLRA